ncbi:MAG: hypothetical protein NTV87_10875, partial [Ignavibacteriae bacterium]|nr:hypothetical protein [Ignavibacteriota bacterium]
MEKLINTLFLFLSASLILNSSLLIQNCQSQWVWQNPLPHGNTVSIVKFVDKNTGWYFSGLSSNYKTTNGGINWFNENLPTSQTIVKADYFRFDSLNSLLVLGGATGAIVKSTNKGNNWILVASPSYNPVLDFHFFNASSGFAVTVYLYKTTDGGMSWDSGTGVERDHRLIYFLNDSVGWMCDYFTFWNHMPTTTYSFYKTTNSGNTWMPKSSTSFYTNANGFNNFIFKDSSEGLVEMYGYISKTTNSGVNWNNIYYGAIFNFINNTVFTAAGNKFVKSTDFGNTWNVIDTVYIRKINETCIEAVDNSDIYLGGTQGDIMKTSNGGVNWSYLNKTFYRNNLISIKCFDSLNLCAFAPGKYIFKSSNGGTNWRVLDTTLFGTDIISTIYFINKDTGWAGCAG